MRVVPLPQAAEPLLMPDLVWDVARQIGDLAVDDATGDLRARAVIETAVLICLQTDRRVEAHELPEGESNRGWPGDGFDVQGDETPLGSRLWLLRRRALTEDIAFEAEDYARESLAPLIAQGLAVRAEVEAERLPERDRLNLLVSLYGRDGATVYQKRFAVLWDQIDGD